MDCCLFRNSDTMFICCTRYLDQIHHKAFYRLWSYDTCILLFIVHCYPCLDCWMFLVLARSWVIQQTVVHYRLFWLHFWYNRKSIHLESLIKWTDWLNISHRLTQQYCSDNIRMYNDENYSECHGDSWFCLGFWWSSCNLYTWFAGKMAQSNLFLL